VHGADDIDNRRGVVQRRKPDEDVDLTDGNQLPEEYVGEGAVSVHCLNPSRSHCSVHGAQFVFWWPRGNANPNLEHRTEHRT
jgi:hypothetical protein